MNLEKLAAEIIKNKVSDAYTRILALLRKEAKNLNNSEVLELHEELKKFFSRLI